ncbi:MAG TPA: succinate dehydrogenase, cytochrome b556 subunit [Bacteroidetes bacterium]|nr:succinate dehydrogenase, cytochrome b556 subunit [Bacteroidota bacterium]
MFYRPKTGMLAWILFRTTGILLIIYLAMHITVISNLHNPGKFNETMAFLGSWQFRLLEIGLYAVVIYHALNGVRILIIDFWKGALFQAKMFWILAAIGLVLFVAGAYPIFTHAMYWKHNPDKSNYHIIEEASIAQETFLAGWEVKDE